MTTSTTVSMPPGAAHLVLYDSVCALCNWSVRFILARDARRRFAFAPLAGATAAEIAARHGQLGEVDSVVLVLDAGRPDERLLVFSDAVLAVARELGPPWSFLAVARLVPRGVRDALYRLVARHRYRWFGRYDACPLPPAAAHARFLD